MGTLQKLRSRLDKAGLRPSAARGQNFLLDQNQLRFIAAAAELGPADVVLEVGPGSGLLTRLAARSGALVLAVEVDRGLLALAMEETAGLPNALYMHGDILAAKHRLNPAVTARLAELLELKRRQSTGGAGEAVLKSVSNLPYAVGTPFIMNLFSSPLPWRSGVFLLQKEVAERLTAAPGSKNYGALSIGAALAATPSIERVVGPRAFWPCPNVDSAVVRIGFNSAEERLGLPWRGIRRIAMAVFGSRRKILKNALKGAFAPPGPAEIMAAAGIPGDARGETLTPEQFKLLGSLWEEREGAARIDAGRGNPPERARQPG